MSEVHRRIFPEAFKREAVAQVAWSGVPASKVAAELGLHETVLRRWMRQLTVSAGTAATRSSERSRSSLRFPISRLKTAACSERTTGCGWKARYKKRHHLRGDSKMKFPFIQENCMTWLVRVLCAVLEVSAGGYYAWRNRAESKRTLANRQLLGEIWKVHLESSGIYRSPRIHAVLCRTGRPVGRSRVEMLMRRAGLSGLAVLPRRPRTTDRGTTIRSHRTGSRASSQRGCPIRCGSST